MKKTVLLASAAVFALCAGAASAAPGVTSKGSNHFAHHVVHHASPPSVVLWDQDSDDSGIGLVSQNFESSFDQYDAQAADDFTVPQHGRWTVKEVDTTGVYFNGSGPAPSVHVTFYDDAGGLPGAAIADFPSVVPASDDFGSFAIKLPSKVKLRKGTYWVSVYVNMDFAAGGEWGWENTSTAQNGSPAAWRNPGDGFATGCTDWSQENVCIAAGQGPDHLFVLRGKSKGG